MSTIIKPSNTLELVLYTVKENQLDQYLNHRQTMVNELSGWDGFIKGATYRSIASPLLYADLFLWASLEHAKAAAERIHETPQCAAFMQCINEIKVYDHSVTTTEAALPEAFNQQVLELAVFTWKEKKHVPLAAARTPLLSDVKKLDGHISTNNFQSLENKERFIDLLVWRDQQALESGQKLIHASANCATFMEMIDESIAFEQLQRVA